MIVFLYIKGAFVGVMNEQFSSIKIHGINNVKIISKSCSDPFGVAASKLSLSLSAHSLSLCLSLCYPSSTLAG
jgi:hypothetical protein